MTITVAQLQPIAIDLQNQVDALNALIAGSSAPTPPPAPPASTVSPDGTKLTPTSGGSILDARGFTWTMGSATTGGYILLRNGVIAYGDGVGIELVIDSAGVVWAGTISGAWYKDSGSGWIGESTGPV